MQLRDWLQYRSLAQEQEEDTGDNADESAHTKKKNRGQGAAVEAEDSSDEGSMDSGSEAANSTAADATVYNRDPALGDLLQFVMSFPYVDEAWGIQDLILVRG